MIQISKEAARAVRRHFPKLHMKRTVNKYFVESSPELVKFLGMKHAE